MLSFAHPRPRRRSRSNVVLLLVAAIAVMNPRRPWNTHALVLPPRAITQTRVPTRVVISIRSRRCTVGDGCRSRRPILALYEESSSSSSSSSSSKASQSKASLSSSSSSSKASQSRSDRIRQSLEQWRRQKRSRKESFKAKNPRMLPSLFTRRLPPPVQLLVAVALYLFHSLVLTQHSLPLPVQLIPNERGHFQSIGLDSLVGMATLGTYQYYRRRQQQHHHLKTTQRQQQPSTFAHVNGDNIEVETEKSYKDDSGDHENDKDVKDILPSLWSTPREEDMPWKGIYASKYSTWTSFGTFWILLTAWRRVGSWSIWIENVLYELAAGDHAILPLTVAMHQSLSVLLGHAAWIVVGVMILRWFPRPQSFFQEPKRVPLSSQNSTLADNANNSPRMKKVSKWFMSTYRDSNWLWWAIGGYVVSAWFFNMADFVNSYLLPAKFLEQAEDASVVSRLIKPEGQDWWASLVGFLAPCINAPWWEEILYRGFLLPALILWIPVLPKFPREWSYPWAIFLSGVLFSVHHISLTAFVPLCVLGWTWAVVYTKSRNLWTTVVIHAMWNSRIFLASWL